MTDSPPAAAVPAAHRIDSADPGAADLTERFPGGVLRDEDDPMAARILRAATRAIAEKGFNGTNIRDIGARGGMSSGSLYNHFGSKTDILATIALRGMIALVTACERAKAEARNDPRAQLDALVAMHVGIHAAHPRESAIGNAELHNLDGTSYAEVVEYRDRQEHLFTSTIEEGIAQGVFDTDLPREAARFIIVACTGIARWYRPGGRIDIDTMIARYQQLARGTVQATGSPQPA